MSTPRTRRSSSEESPSEDELRLPRPPGIIRRFWARHPLLADVLIALLCLILSAAPATDYGSPDAPPVGVVIALTLIVLVACALLLRRRQWPTIILIAAYVVAAVYLLLIEPAGGVLLLVASYGIAVYRSTRAAWAGLAIGTGTLIVLSLLLVASSTITLQAALNGVIGQFALALIGTLVGVIVGGRARYVEAIIDRSRQLLVERDQQAQLAAASERARIAREMHDIVSHSLTVIVALSEGAAATTDPVKAKDASARAAETARGALTEMRSVLGVLRQDGAAAPLAPGAPVDPHTTVAAAQGAGYPVALSVIGSAASDPAVAYAVGRIVQEGITNAMRHAPHATSATVSIVHRDVGTDVEIENDGVTARGSSTGFGLRGLGERASRVGGTLEAGPRGEGRWLLRAHLPAGGGESK